MMICATLQLPIELTGLAGFVVRLGFTVTAALLCAWAASAMARRLSAAMRHRIWALGTIVALLIPAMLVIAPQRRLDLIEYPTNTMQHTATAGSETTAISDNTPVRVEEKNGEEKNGDAASFSSEKTSCVPVSRPPFRVHTLSQVRLSNLPG